MTKVPRKCISSHQLHIAQYTTHYTCTHKVRAYACSLTNQNHQPTPCQRHTRLGGYGNSLERQRHSLMQHVLMLIITLTGLTHEIALVLFLQRRETTTMIQLVTQPVMGGRDTHYHKDTLHTPHQNFPFKPTQTCQL